MAAREIKPAPVKNLSLLEIQRAVDTIRVALDEIYKELKRLQKTKQDA